MKLPHDLGMKKAKQHPEFIEISGKMIFKTVLCTFAVIALTVLALMTPWEELKASLIAQEDTTQQELIDELKAMNLTLRAIQQKDSTVKDGHEYLLVENVEGTIPFLIHENTCTNGARMIARLRDEFRGMRQPQTGSIQIAGVSTQKSRSIYSAVVTVSDAMPAQMRNLPNDMMLENDTVFLTYQIAAGENANRVEYKLECY
jgi:hypothetical protein